MAFTLPSSTLAENYFLISRHDAAVDKSASDFEDQWKRYLDDAADPPLKPGADPTRFELKHLNRRERNAVNTVTQQLNFYQGMYLSCAYALVGAKNLHDGDGQPIRFTRELDKFEHERVRFSDLDKLPDEVVIELGLIAYNRSEALKDPLS